MYFRVFEKKMIDKTFIIIVGPNIILKEELCYYEVSIVVRDPILTTSSRSLRFELYVQYLPTPPPAFNTIP